MRGRIIYQSAWKGNSANFTLMELGIFARVPSEYPVRGFTEGERKPRAVPSLYRALALLCRLWTNFAFTEFSEVQSRNTAYADSTLADRCERSVFFAQIKALREPLR
jgi:hypothetical protein